MYIYIDTVRVIRLVMLIGQDEYFKRKNITKRQLDDVLHGNLDAPLLTYLKVAESLNLKLEELVFMCHDECKEISINGLIGNDDTPIPYN